MKLTKIAKVRAEPLRGTLAPKDIQDL